MSEPSKRDELTTPPQPESAPPPMTTLIEHPKKITRYSVVRHLAAGGMGSVYECIHDVTRAHAAVKLVRPGFDSREVLARFEAERIVLARFDHPNIARVLDAGTDEATGRPYFAMEFVPGALPITDFADKERLSLRQRLELFLQVCSAIQHAHTKAILHRDIKPGNVLAYHADGKPSVKVIDFGIAKALSGEQLIDAALVTEVGVMIGTYEYMSPEQAQGSADIDTRSDVYSLGVLLYELLAGVKPFDRRDMVGAIDMELRRYITEVDAQRPSTRLSGLGDPGTRLALQRSTRLESLTRELRRELEWIPLMALRKERNRRYASVDQLASDVGNYLSGAALIAGPESWTYKFRKTVVRRRVPITVAAVVAIGLLAGAGGIIAGRFNALRAEQARATSERVAGALDDFLTSDLIGTISTDEDAGQVTLRDALVRSAPQFVERFAEQPDTSLRLRRSLAGAMIAVGDLGAASEQLKSARQQLAGKPANDPRVNTQLDLMEAVIGWRNQDPTTLGNSKAIADRARAQLGPSDPLTLWAETDLANAIKNTARDAPLQQRLSAIDTVEASYRDINSRANAEDGNQYDRLFSLAELPIERGMAYGRAAKTPDGTDAQREEWKQSSERLYRQGQDELKRLRVRVIERFGITSPRVVEIDTEIAYCIHRLGDLAGADAAYAALIDPIRRTIGLNNWRSINLLKSWQFLLSQRQAKGEASVDSYRTLFAAWREAGDPAQAIACAIELSKLYRLKKQPDEAERMLLWSLEETDSLPGDARIDIRGKVIEQLIDLDREAGRTDRSTRWQATTRP